ncbi:MAG TPA: GAF domain-containing protein, partial [Syntrophobacteraceae bacterium]|nr:GAF domain-containing protein [Syntrophobacteraceae bacterium]
MNQTAKEIIRCGLFDAHSQQEESGIFLAMMGRLAELISQGLGAQQVCRALLRIIIEETGVENCSLLRWDAQNDSLSLVVAGGLENLFRENTVREYNRSLSFSAGEGMAGRAFSKKYPVFIQDSTLEAIPFKAGAVVRPTSLVSVPLLDFGVLNMSSFHPQKFTTQIRCFWEHFGKIVG